MGTSASSSGPGAGVALVPPWVNAPEGGGPLGPSSSPNAGSGGNASLDPNGAQPSSAPEPATVAPPASPSSSAVAGAGRFRGARTSLGNYARTGASSDLRRGLGHYVRRGLGGAARASARMERTASSAGLLYRVLGDLSTGGAGPGGTSLDPAELSRLSPKEVADRIAYAVSPNDGTLDSEASRDSISRAFAELLRLEPLADLTSLTAEQILIVIELSVANDICTRIELDVGKAILEKASSATEAFARREAMDNYVKQSVAASFRKLEADGQRVGRDTTRRVTQRVIRETFEVFEEYVK